MMATKAKRVQKRSGQLKPLKTAATWPLEEGVFTWNDPKRIARSFAYSARISVARKVQPLQSAMSLLNFYINRAGKNLPAARKKVLE